MKIRQGFISNSSSSSFIVVFDKKLEDYTDSELSKYLYKTSGETVKDWREYARKNSRFQIKDLLRVIRSKAKPVSVTPQGLAIFKDGEERVFGSLQDWRTSRNFFEEVTGKAEDNWTERDWEKIEDISDGLLREQMQNLYHVHIKDKDVVVYTFDFEDYLIEEAILDNPNSFHNVPHVYECHH